MSAKDGNDNKQEQQAREHKPLEAPDAHKVRNASAQAITSAEAKRPNASDGSLRDRSKVTSAQDDSIQIMGMAGIAASRKNKLSEKDLLANKDPAARSIDIRELLAKPDKAAQDLVEEFGRVTKMPAGPTRDAELLKVQLLADKTYNRGQFARSAHEAEQSSERRAEKSDGSKATDISPAEKATAMLLETASQRFGTEKVHGLHVKQDDVGSALSVLALGPDICKSFRPDEMHNLGNRFLVFGVAPVFGMAETAKNQLTQHPLEQAHSASSNYLSGAAIGMLLEHVHPAVMAASIVGGASMFVKGQLSSPEHRARNKELSAIATKIDSASNSELFYFAGRTKTLLGPDLYHGTFDFATGTPALPNGSAVNAAVKEEALAMSKFDVKDGIKVLQGLGHEAWGILKPLLEQPGMRPAFADGVQRVHSAVEQISLAESMLRMQGEHRSSAERLLSSLRDNITAIGPISTPESFDSLVKVHEKLMKTSSLPVPSRSFADSLSAIEDKFIEHIKTVRTEVASLKQHAEIIENKAQPTASENNLLENFYSASDTLYEVITGRLRTLYGWNRDVGVALDKGFYFSSGMDAQRGIGNKISSLFEHGLERDEVVQRVLSANGMPLERAKNWVGLPITGASAADHAGCDYLLANTVTGEMYTFDITQRVFNMKSGSLVESRLINPRLEFPNKNIPKERMHLVIGVADDLSKDNAIYNLDKDPTLRTFDAAKRIEIKEKEQIAEIIAQTISRRSALNIIDTPLPSALPATPASRQVYELWRFGMKLEELGYLEWAASLKRAIRFIKIDNPNLPYY